MSGTTDPTTVAGWTTVLWSAGHNLAGYLPESSPDLCESAESARESLEWHLDSLADHLAQGCELEEDESERELAELAECEEALAELAGADLISDAGFLFYVGHSAYWISPVPLEDWPEELVESLEAGEKLSDALAEYWDGCP